ncbi:two-component system response regulator BtsR [Photobacterium damselae subsp. piscicida]|uniref:two-component system response regulator BtsR n=1 Tax=Photobacterium damselae TaxID=38293 RepID=UPI0002E4C360|nr:two-component system response regulator BtsR [Photobacterium damselae]OLQ82243.1 two-component system response regulator YehT [Photobacterium damselae subsp. piscicida]TFZ62648.1 two-component system response regulator BtsR [Photobacterium damselae subsp. piscicida]TJZ94621.1 two-component system response regulator BtsR [Photobacterium damselae subsp. piscicida]BBC39816.1 transcriptional regulatory protein YehT [Photobacterium damselae subsp. piscicida]
MLKALVIDDELFAREELIDLLEESQQVQVLDSSHNAIDGLKKIHSLKPDVVFLDIEMPQISGIELLTMLDPETMPKIVFVTAYDEYALQAFEDNAFDYLLKPVEPQRLTKTLTRLTKELEPKDYSPLIQEQLELIPCCGHNRILLLNIKEIEIAFSDLSGVHIVTKETKACSQLSLKILEQKSLLMRCHRQYLINPTAIREIRLLENNLAEIITISGHSVPVSRRYLKTLKERLQIT